MSVVQWQGQNRTFSFAPVLTGDEACGVERQEHDGGPWRLVFLTAGMGSDAYRRAIVRARSLSRRHKGIAFRACVLRTLFAHELPVVKP